MGDSRGMLKALQLQGGARFDPARFRFIEALAGRAASSQGDVRRLLEERLAAALQDYCIRLEEGRRAVDQILPFALARHPDTADTLARLRQEGDFRGLRQLLAGLEGGQQRRILQPLVDHIRALAQDVSWGAVPGVGGDTDSACGELKSVALFRDSWLNLSVGQQLSEALAQVPDNAGPLNSHLLALQSLELMRDASPEYLQHFISYVDGLLWLELAENGSKPAAKSAPARGERDKKRKPGRSSSGSLAGGGGAR